jgi:hypothetical protein
MALAPVSWHYGKVGCEHPIDSSPALILDCVRACSFVWTWNEGNNQMHISDIQYWF